MPGSRSALLPLLCLVGCGTAQPPPAIPPVSADAGRREPGEHSELEHDAEVPRRAHAPDWAVTAAEKITDHARKQAPRAWDRLAYVGDMFGHRLSGSEALEKTIVWAMETMASDGMENSRREAVKVPHWVRGKESLTMTSPVERRLTLLGLGGSVGTKGALKGRVAVVSHVDEIAKNAADLAGKIVLINQVMPPYDYDAHDSHYGETVQARSRGAVEAARVGAKAVLIRSVTAYSLKNPHTGAMHYADDVKKIPAAAVTVEDAELLSRMVKRGPTSVDLRMGARTLKDADSANVVAELPGREKRDEVVVIGGHIDSWDVGDGSTDDMSGCIMAMEAVLMLKELGLVPRRTIRVVLFTNEENGLRGGKAYHEKHGKETHAGAIEADAGSAAPFGFSVKGEDAQVEALAAYSDLFVDIGAATITKGWGGADISPLTDDGVLGLALRPDGSHYFDLHHSPADTVDKVDPKHLQMNAAAMALMAYILAERE